MADDKPGSGAIQYLSGLPQNGNVDIGDVNSVFAQRMQNLISDAEAATGEKVTITSGFRSPEHQAQIYANYKQKPVVYGGKTYTPNGRSGIAAPPGVSEHQTGTAMDIAPHGAAYKWMVAHAKEYGVVSGTTWSGEQYDPPHFQLPRSEVPAALAGRLPSPPPANIPNAPPVPAFSPTLSTRNPVAPGYNQVTDAQRTAMASLPPTPPPLPIPRPPGLAATGTASMGLAPPAIAGGSAFIPPQLPQTGSVGVPMQLLGPDQAQQQVASNIANETPAPGPNTPYSVSYGKPPRQTDWIKGQIINRFSYPGDDILQPVANGLGGMANWLAPPPLPTPTPTSTPGIQDIPSIPSSASPTIIGRDITPPSIPTASGSATGGVSGGGAGASGHASVSPLPSGAISGTVQLPPGVRPQVTVPTLPAAPTTKTISVVNPAYTAWMNNQMPTPPALPGSGLSVSGGAIGGIGQGGYASGSIAIPHSTPAPPKTILRTVPVPQVRAPIPLSPPQDELAAIRAGAENPFQRAFDGTPLGHIANFAGNLANGGAHYGAPASGGLLGLLSGGGGGGLGGLLGALTPGSNIAALFGDMSGAQQANQNPAAMAAGLAGQSYYSAPNGAAIPILAMNGNPRNSYGDAANHIGSSLTQSWF